MARGLKAIEIRSFNNFSEAFQALRAGQVDGTTAIDGVAMFMQSRGDFTRAISGLCAGGVPLLGARPITDAVISVMNEMKKDGFYQALFEKYGVLQVPSDTFAVKGTGPNAVRTRRRTGKLAAHLPVNRGSRFSMKA